MRVPWFSSVLLWPQASLTDHQHTHVVLSRPLTDHPALKALQEDLSLQGLFVIPSKGSWDPAKVSAGERYRGVESIAPLWPVAEPLPSTHVKAFLLLLLFVLFFETVFLLSPDVLELAL